VIVGDLTGPANYGANGSYEALALGTTSCNMGTANLNWHSNTNQHPVIGGELYRYKVVDGSGRFEQVGISWLKHGFYALSQTLCCTGCQGTDGSQLGVRCSDPYTASRNGQQSGLGPRYQVNASTGYFTYPPPRPSGGNAGRVEVLVSDLEATAGGGARYFGNAQYIAPDDAAAGNDNNNSSYKEISVSGSGSAWTFGFIGSTVREVPAVKAWASCEAGVTSRNLQIAGDGLVILNYKTTNLGGGQYHYEYALYNMNSHNSVRSFSIPIANDVNVTNIGFHDVGYRAGDGEGGVNRDGTDWTATNSGGSLTWSTSTFAQNPNANALRWGTTYNFRFDADTPPMTDTLTLGLFRNGGATTSTIDVPSPGGPPPDTDGDGILDPNDNCPTIANPGQENNDNDAQGDVCDADDDNDFRPDTSDNCPLVANPSQENFDGDAEGDACDLDDDNDGTDDVSDGCPLDPQKTAPGGCGCGTPDTDSDGDGALDCVDGCPDDPNKTSAGTCGCGISEVDADADGTPDCVDGCPGDPNKIAPGVCGCGIAETDTDADGAPDCVDGCPSDPAKTAPGACGCGVSDADADGDAVIDCNDNCTSVANPGQEDCDADLIGDACELAGGAGDCNLNGIPDECDIAGGVSLDANGNGIPDECQTGNVSLCFGDGSVRPCPCSNDGATGHGCANSTPGSPGAQLHGSGSTVPDTMVLTATDEKPTALTVFFQGDALLGSAVVFGDGLRCSGGDLKRIAVKSASGGVASYPGTGDPSISARSAALGDPLTPGTTRIYSAHYRDPDPTFCPMPTGSTFNSTQAILLVW